MGHLVEDFRLVISILWALKRVNTEMLSDNGLLSLWFMVVFEVVLTLPNGMNLQDGLHKLLHRQGRKGLK